MRDRAKPERGLPGGAVRAGYRATAYDPASVTLYWRQLLAADRVFQEWRSGFIGKDSPVQVFWGSMDLSCVRYSGRVAPAYAGTPPPSARGG